MDSFYVKEEWPGSSCLYWGAPSSSSSSREAAPQPMEGLGTGPPPFLNKTYDLVDDLSTNFIVSWGKGNNTFVVWDPQLFSLNLLPKYFKHSNFSSFVRQLNTYGFRKVDPDKWEFANEGFLRGKRHLLKNIKRKKTTSSQSQSEDPDTDPCIELGRFGADAEIDMLKRDKQVLMEELVKLRQDHQNTRGYLKAMEERIQGTERKQQRMMHFLVRALHNPGFVQQLIQQKDSRKELEDAVSSKRRRPIAYGDLDNGKFGKVNSGGEGNDFTSNSLENYGEVTDIDNSELHKLAMEMQAGGDSKNLEKGYLQKQVHESGNGGLDQRFWEDLMNDSIEEEKREPFGFVREEVEFRQSSFWSGIQFGLLSKDHMPSRKELLVLQLEKGIADGLAIGVAFDAYLIEGNW